MSKKISLNDFAKMTPDSPEFSNVNQHYLIANANPTYYLDSVNTQEVQKAPLVASLQWKQITSSLDGNIVAVCSGNSPTGSAIFLMTTTSQIYSVTDSDGVPAVVTALGYPSGVITSITDGYLTYVNNQLYIIYNGISVAYRLATSYPHAGVVTISIASPAVITATSHGYSSGDQVIFNTTGSLPTGIVAGVAYYVISAGLTTNSFEISATLNGSAINTTGSQSGVHTAHYVFPTFGSVYGYIGTILEPFLEYCMISQSNLVQKIDSSYNVLTGLNIGSGWNVMGMKNLNDKYIAIVGQLSSNFNQCYLFLWNGRDNTYQYSCKVSGQFIDMNVIEGILYVAVSVSNGASTLYYLKATNLVPVMAPQYSQIDNVGYFASLYHVNSVFNYANSVGLRLQSTSDMTFPIMLYDGDLKPKDEFIISSGNQFYGLIIGADGYNYAYQNNAGGVATLWYYPIVNTAYLPILYKSLWIPVKNLSGIDIIYDTPPQSGTDAINVTIYGKGEDIISGTSTTVLTSITPSTILNNTRTRLDVQGFVGDKVLIVLSTVNTGAWRPIIRSIDLITEE